MHQPSNHEVVHQAELPPPPASVVEDGKRGKKGILEWEGRDGAFAIERELIGGLSAGCYKNNNLDSNF
ncbi:hypothetical protein C2845_PM15G02380 [Panicum miliaceum]|uniref:Uncharacterized protein n=1 Tax=Panicum miliaceum TaxID=4540 RepID=A0A3L6Q438_PANMI|nr:hypothetical protein C2845_PM15G02380 [Panicum miliaceum]